MWDYYASYWILIPAILFTFYAQAKVSSNFKRYSKVRNDRNLTGAQAARMVLDANGLRDVQIEAIHGSLDRPLRTRAAGYCAYRRRSAMSILWLRSASPVTKQGTPCSTRRTTRRSRLRNAIVPVVYLAHRSRCWPLAILGIVLLGNGSYIGDTLFNIAVIAMLAVILFHAVTLPVEFNASSRALKQMEALSIVDDAELPGAKKVLRAAAIDLTWRRLPQRLRICCVCLP